jgi:hypothetical protein
MNRRWLEMFIAVWARAGGRERALDAVEIALASGLASGLASDLALREEIAAFVADGGRADGQEIARLDEQIGEGLRRLGITARPGSEEPDPEREARAC